MPSVSTPTPPPDGLPRFFLDRNLGSIAVPAGLRAAGVLVVSLSERYGVHEGENIAAETWMGDAAAAGEAVLMAVRRFVTCIEQIERACRKLGPFVYRLHPERIEKRRLPTV